jgi:exodeoxyribonuclease V beta subunit
MKAVRFDPLSLPLSGTRVIEASAGTGKTYSIALLYLRSVLERRLSPREVLVVTFTRAATAELRDRIRARVREARELLRTGAQSEDALLERLLAPYRDELREDAITRLASVLDELDRASIFTIDGFCQRVLAEHAFSSGARFDSELIQDDSSLLAAVAHDLWLRRYGSASPDEARRAVLSRKELLVLLKHALAHRELAIEPRCATDADVAEARARFESAAETYRAERAAFDSPDAVMASVCSVRKSKVSDVSCVLALDDLAAGRSVPSAKPPKGWDYLSAEALSQKLKKGAEWPPSHGLFDAVDDLVASSVELYRVALATEAAWFVREAKPSFDALTLGRGRSTFASVLVQLAAALRDGERGAGLAAALGATYGIALIDECQDTSETQFDVFSAIFRDPKHALLFIGDPKQAIYGFRGADVHAYLKARDSAASRYEMAQNFRSSPALLEALGVLYREATKPFGDVDIEYTPVTAGRAEDAFDTLVEEGSEAPVLDVLFVPKGEPGEPNVREVEVAAADIAVLLRTTTRRAANGAESALRPKDIAVLCRSNGMVEAVSSALRRLGVPAVSASRRSVFRSDEAEALERVLRAVVDPKDGRAQRAAWLSSLVGAAVSDVAFLRDDDEASSLAASKLSGVKETWLRLGVGAALRRFFDEQGLEERWLKLPDGFRRITNIGHLLELVAEAEARLRLSPERLVSWLARAREGDDDTEEGERGLRLEHSGNAVQVLTVHRSKGLEYDVVYLVGLGGVRQGGDKTHSAVVRRESGERVVVADTRVDASYEDSLKAATFEEGARLVYVGLTRAKLALRVVVKAAAKETSSSGLLSAPLGRVLLAEGTEEGKAPVDGERLFGLISARFLRLSEGGLRVRARREEGVHAERYVAREARLELVPPPERTRLFRQALSVASFSRLISGAPHAPAADHDRSAFVDMPEPVDFDPLAELKGGTELGHLVHGVFERIDFDADEKSLASAIEQALSKRTDFAGAEGALKRVVSRTLATPMLESGAALAHVQTSRTLRELEFEVLADGRGRLTASGLAEVFARFGGEVERRYAPHVAELPFRSVEGFLHGFIDLVFEHEGRYYVADYKTNRLGTFARYAPEALASPMMSSHYLLQSSLYLVALHRLLRERVADYAFETHLGGSLYLFVRGIAPEHPKHHGVFAHSPPFALVHALDRLFDGDSP